MAFRLFQALSRRHLLTSEIEPRMAKAALADVRKAETWRALGQAVARVQQLHGLSLKEFADALGVDERQVARWIAGSERPQVETVFAVPRFKSSIVVALAEQVEGLSIETVVRVAR